MENGGPLSAYSFQSQLAEIRTQLSLQKSRGLLALYQV